jgi:hypothetical protein
VYVCIAHKTLLEVRQRALLLVDRDGSLLCLVGISPLGEREVVEKPSRLKPLGELRLLNSGGIEAVLKGKGCHR